MVIDTVFLKMALIDAGGDNGHVINIQIGKNRCIVGKRFLQPDAERLVVCALTDTEYVAAHVDDGAFDAGFGVGEEMLTGLTALGAERGVEFDEAGFAASEPLMRVQLKALVAQRLFDTGAFYRVMNPAQNGAYRRAVEILGGWEREGAPLLMPEN